MRRISLLAVPLLLLLSGCSGDSATAKGGITPAADPGKEVLLRFKPAEGDKYTTSMQVDIVVKQGQGEAKPMSAQMKMESQDEVIKVADGKVTTKSTITESSGTGDGPIGDALSAQFKPLEGKTTTSITDERGTVVDAGDLATGPMMNNPRPVYPEKPIKKGDTWSETVETNGQKVVASFKAEGLEMVDGKEAMKIVMTSRVNSPAGEIEFPMSMWIDVSNGRLIRGEGKMSMNQPGMSMDMSMKMSTK